MKKHAIIPIFIPHRGCPNACVFCNQRKITARQDDVTPEKARQTIETWLTTLGGVETVEIAFFGGSFTGIPMEEQSAFLALAKEYKDAGRIHQIHLSTRPDYITEEILDNLKKYSVDVIELGVQSLDDQVLAVSGRGHDAACVYRAAEMMKDYGFTLGIQLMVG
ncbi:MAG: radical SAM protein, partial [Firmicutes bacterium]|nr:radical SAM protein [Bacillota bacterium]